MHLFYPGSYGIFNFHFNTKSSYLPLINDGDVLTILFMVHKVTLPLLKRDAQNRQSRPTCFSPLSHNNNNSYYCNVPCEWIVSVSSR